MRMNDRRNLLMLYKTTAHFYLNKSHYAAKNLSTFVCVSAQDEILTKKKRSNLNSIICRHESSNLSDKYKINWLNNNKTAKENKKNLEKEFDQKLRTDGVFYHEKIIIGYSSEQMCDMVFDVAKYKEFVPFCIGSEIIDTFPASKTNKISLSLKNINLNLRQNANAGEADIKKYSNVPQSFKAKLEIGYPPIKESYTSHVTMIRPNLVRAISKDTDLFEFLINEWKFHPNPRTKDFSNLSNDTNFRLRNNLGETSCLVEFYVSFKFHNPFYSKFSQIFMDQIFKKMVEAFTSRANVLYGKPSIASINLN
jgi:coenzyme Q-binding protein COQ10